MLTEFASRALVVTALVAAACGTDVGPPVAAPVSAAPTATATPAPRPEPRKELVHGAIAILRLPDGGGSLWITVEHVAKVGGGATVTADYQRDGACSLSGSDGVCPVKWRVRRTLRPGQFAYDETLDRATLTDTVKGQRVSVTWTGFGDVTRQENQNGNRLTETRRAVGDSRWGAAHYVDPSVEAKTDSMVYVRVT